MKNTSDLRRFLLEVMTDIRKGNLEPRQGAAISALTSQILSSARLDLLAASAPIPRVTTTLLISKDDKITHPYPDLTNEQYNEILDMKKVGKDIATVSEKFRTKDKKLIGAVYYGKPYDI